MKYKLIIRPEAENDLTKSSEWYENQRKGLGHDFILCVEAGLKSIKENSKMYRKIYKNIRRTLIRRFPYGIFYLIDEDNIIYNTNGFIILNKSHAEIFQ